MAVKIALDCGHGLNTVGKQTPNGIKEWTLNDKVRDKVVQFLKEYDVEILHTDFNEGITDESLASRLQMYLNAGVKAFVSIHHNAYNGKWNGVTGVEVYTDREPTQQDIKLANCIYNRLTVYTGLKGRGIKEKGLYVINQDRIPAILVEGGFMDSTKDYSIITSDKGQTAYAQAVAEGLIEFLGLKKIVKTTPTTKLTVDGKWGTTTTKMSQKVLGTVTDGKISKQMDSLKKYVPNALVNSWEFVKANYGSGSSLIKAIQKLVGVTADGQCGKNTVKGIQTFLNKNGFNCGSADGYMGEKTVKAWQQYINSKL